MRELHERLTGEDRRPRGVDEPRAIEGLENAADAIVGMRDQSELAIGLAYTVSLHDV